MTAETEAILVAACSTVGVATDGVSPIRLGENAVYRLPGGVVARVSRPGQQLAARREVAVSRWLNRSGITAVAAVDNLQQPVEIDGRSVTFWKELPAHRHGSLIQLATALKRLHSLPVPADLALDHLDPFVRLHARINAAVTLHEDDRAWLRAQVAELSAQWPAVRTTLPTCVVHGDAWAGNVVATNDGQAIVLDLERCSIGPGAWDLVSTAVRYRTCGRISSSEYRQFSDVYGRDVTTAACFNVLRDIREIRMTCYVAQQASIDPHFEHEARLRVACLRGLRGPRPWPWTPAE